MQNSESSYKNFPNYQLALEIYWFRIMKEFVKQK